MSDQTIEQQAPSRRRGRRRRTDWRLGGSTVRPWDGMLLAVTFACLGAGVLGGLLIGQFGPVSWRSFGSTLALWIGMLAPAVLAFVRSRPAGLLKFRAADLLYGVALGILVRLVQGWTDPSQAFPSLLVLDGDIPMTWWLSEALGSGVVAPVIEEFFFRALLIVLVFSLLRKTAGRPAAGFIAAALSTGAFVLLHAIDGALPMSEAIPLAVLGAVCSLLVLLTGRIWGAVLVHLVYNLTGVALAVVGTLLAA